MKDFVIMDIVSTLKKIDVFEILTQDLVEFNWAMGESDAQGGYISGRNAQGVTIKFWIDEHPMHLSVSFRSSDLDLKSREEVLEKISRNIIPRIGVVFEVHNTYV